jgi:two-component system chemotaxis sensor kinase CheA
MDDILREFLVESSENLDQLDRDFVELEKDPKSRERLASVFRTIHTIKGTCGFLGFPKLETVTHAGENLLSRLRDGVLVLNPEITSALLTMVDAVRQMLSEIEASGAEGEKDYTALVETLTRLQSDEPKVDAPEPARSPAAEKPDDAAPTPSTILSAQPELASLPIGELLVHIGRIVQEQVAAALQQQQEGDPRHLGEILVDQGAVEPSVILDALPVQKETRESLIASSTIRVDVGRLDKLMNLVGELVLVRNQILQFSANQQDATFLGTTQRLNLITT